MVKHLFYTQDKKVQFFYLLICKIKMVLIYVYIINYIYLLHKNLIIFNSNIIIIILLLSIFFSILTIINNNPVYSVLLLISLFLFISIYLILIGSTFIGISYILVYIGAISILFLFTLMLVNIRLSELLLEDNKIIYLGLFFIFNIFIFFKNIIFLVKYNYIENDTFNILNIIINYN